MDSSTHMHRKEGQLDIPWNVQLSLGTVRRDGQFTAFLDNYEGKQ